MLREFPTLEEHLEFWRRTLNPKKHGVVAWMLIWRHGFDLGMPGLGGALECLENPWWIMHVTQKERDDTSQLGESSPM